MPQPHTPDAASGTERGELRHYLRRGPMSGSMEIVDRQFDFVRCILPYDYRFTSNSQQWREAELICRALEGPMESLGVISLAPASQAAPVAGVDLRAAAVRLLSYYGSTSPESEAAWDALEKAVRATPPSPPPPGDAERLDLGELERLSDPVAVHINMLRGFIARPSVENIIHLYGADVLRNALASRPEGTGGGDQTGATSAFQPKIETCPKCGSQGVAFICDQPGCPVNGGAAYPWTPTPTPTPDPVGEAKALLEELDPECGAPESYVEFLRNEAADLTQNRQYRRDCKTRADAIEAALATIRSSQAGEVRE